MQNPALQHFLVTYAPAYRPSGVPIDTNASRQVLAQRKIAPIEALDSDGAIASFERDSGCMVTACKRLQPEGAAA